METSREPYEIWKHDKRTILSIFIHFKLFVHTCLSFTYMYTFVYLYKNTYIYTDVHPSVIFTLVRKILYCVTLRHMLALCSHSVPCCWEHSLGRKWRAWHSDIASLCISMRVFTLFAFPPCQWIPIHCNAACCQVGCHLLFDDVSKSLAVHVFAGKGLSKNLCHRRLLLWRRCVQVCSCSSCSFTLQKRISWLIKPITYFHVS